MIEFATHTEYPFRASDDDIHAARKKMNRQPRFNALASPLQFFFIFQSVRGRATTLILRKGRKAVKRLAHRLSFEFSEEKPQTCASILLAFQH